MTAREDALAQAHRDLLDRVVVAAADDAAAYRRIQRAEERLARFYREGPGWSLVRTRAFARLVREPAPCAAGRGLPGLEEPLDYALFTWVLWYGEYLLLGATAAGGGENQFVMSELAEAILGQGSGAAGPRLDLLDHRHRQSLVRALRSLEGLGAIRRLQGDPEAWAPNSGANVLYEFLPAAGRLLAARADWEGVFALATGPGFVRTEPPAPAAATPLQRAWRALLLGPVFYRPDDPEAFATLQAARGEVQGRLQEVLGWDLDLRRSYALVLRPGAAGEDGPVAALQADGAVVQVERRAVYQPILLLAAAARRRVAAREWVPDGDDVIRLPLAEFENALWELREEHRERWGVTLGGDPRLAETVLAEMRFGGLARGPDAEGFVYLMPALGRVTGRYAEGEAPRPRRARPAAGAPRPVAIGLF